MTSTLETVTRKLRGGDPTEVPRWTMPMLLDPKKCPTLGAIGRRTFHDWPDQRLELETDGELLDRNSPAISEGPYFRVQQPDGGYLLQPLRAHIRGTYATRITAVTRGPRQPGPQGPLDFLDANSVLTGYGGAGRYSIRGCAEIESRYGSKGVVMDAGDDPSYFDYTAADSRLNIAMRQELRELAPLMGPYKFGGKPPACVVCKHPAYVPATTLRDTGGAPRPWCKS